MKPYKQLQTGNALIIICLYVVTRASLLTAVVCYEERIYLLSNKNTNDGQLKTPPVICCLVGTSKVCPDGWMASANRGVKMTPKECLFCVCGTAREQPFKALLHSNSSCHVGSDF